jgi:hypothetical protein
MDGNRDLERVGLRAGGGCRTGVTLSLETIDVLLVLLGDLVPLLEPLLTILIYLGLHTNFYIY